MTEIPEFKEIVTVKCPICFAKPGVECKFNDPLNSWSVYHCSRYVNSIGMERTNIVLRKLRQ